LCAAIKRFIHEFTGVAEKRIVNNTSLQKDLGIEGDDADDFMQTYAQKFNVDLESFKFTDYFSVEGGFNPISYLFVRIFNPAHLKKQTITLADLVNAARKGKWISK